jgi:pyruvate/2-oxoglutarate dehydrogenase complex dihydrolipoamide dehydrogenase (E3) component
MRQYKNAKIIATNPMKVNMNDTAGRIPKSIEHAEAANKITMIEGNSNFSSSLELRVQEEGRCYDPYILV